MNKLDLFEKYFYLDESSESGLRNKLERYSGRNYKNKFTDIEDIAGSKDVKGYYCLTLFRSTYKVHRIIYSIYHRIEIPSKSEIDHIDGNPSNNKIENLRLVERTINARNHSKRKHNTSGVTGVSLKDNEGWVALWYEDRIKFSKYFSISKYGELAFVLACEYRANKIKELNTKGYGYSDRHGILNTESKE